MYRIKTYNQIAPEGLAAFPQTQYQLNPTHQAAQAILLRSHVLAETNIPTDILAIARAGAGVNNLPVAALSQRGIPVFNTPGSNANAVKELVLAGLLIASRNLTNAWQFVQNMTQSAVTHEVESAKKQFVGMELPGKTLAVIGLGAIGVHVANAAVELGMNVIGYDPGITIQNAWRLSCTINQSEQLLTAIKNADFVTIHVPYSDATRHLIDTNAFDAMKPNVTLLNFARDGLVEPDALQTALDQERLHYYVTDFPTAEHYQHPRVIAFPHLGASTGEAESASAIMAATQLRDYLETGQITNSVNFPTVKLPPQTQTTGERLAITNRNVPNMVGQISTHLANCGLNILEMINQSRGELAYTLIDVDNPLPPAITQQLNAIDGVLSVRVIRFV